MTQRKTTVVNVTTDKYDVYGGRPQYKNGKPVYQNSEVALLGNPHEIGKCGTCGKVHTREEAIELYASYFAHRIETDEGFKRYVATIRGLRLGCFCTPEYACHLQVVANYLNTSGRDKELDEFMRHTKDKIDFSKYMSKVKIES